ncbi:hypothetical protein PT2222_290065 [Paraburkholderia tropica]
MTRERRKGDTRNMRATIFFRWREAREPGGKRSGAKTAKERRAVNARRQVRRGESGRFATRGAVARGGHGGSSRRGGHRHPVARAPDHLHGQRRGQRREQAVGVGELEGPRDPQVRHRRVAAQQAAAVAADFGEEVGEPYVVREQHTVGPVGGVRIGGREGVDGARREARLLARVDHAHEMRRVGGRDLDRAVQHGDVRAVAVACGGRIAELAHDEARAERADPAVVRLHDERSALRGRRACAIGGMVGRTVGRGLDEDFARVEPHAAFVRVEGHVERGGRVHVDARAVVEHESAALAGGRARVGGPDAPRRRAPREIRARTGGQQHGQRLERRAARAVRDALATFAALGARERGHAEVRGHGAEFRVQAFGAAPGARVFGIGGAPARAGGDVLGRRVVGEPHEPLRGRARDGAFERTRVVVEGIERVEGLGLGVRGAVAARVGMRDVRRLHSVISKQASNALAI